MKSIWIDYEKLLEVCSRLMDGHVSYGFGIKAKLTADPKDIKSIDCSGFVRYVISNATNGEVTMPDGSWVQNNWCKTSGFERVAYSTAANSDGWLRIAFLPSKGGAPGHVWLILNGQTMESHGGKGPDRRPWDTKVLKSGVSDCYKLAMTFIFYDGPFQPSDTAYA